MGRLHVETFDDGAVGAAGQPVVLVHSSGLSGRQWRRLASMLARRGFRVHVPDLTGHGASPPCPEPTPFSYRQDVTALAELLRTGSPAHVVGHSYGGLIAALAALEVPDAIRSLVLFDPVTFGVLDSVADRAAAAELRVVDLPWGADAEAHERWLTAFVDYWGGAGAWLALRAEARAEFLRVGWVVHQGVTTLKDDRTPATAYEAISCPVTLMTGERSPPAAGAVVKHLAGSFPNVKVDTVPEAGHMAPLSHADRVNRTIFAALTVDPAA